MSVLRAGKVIELTARASSLFLDKGARIQIWPMGMTRHLVGALALLLAVVHAAVTPVAHATPPDPVWEDGFFDDDDGDNGVVSITSSTATLDSFPRRHWSVFAVSRPAPVRELHRLAPAQYRSVVDARAPPRS